MNCSLIQILFNVLGGVISGFITIGLIEFYKKIRSFFHLHKFKQIFGKDVLNGSEFYLVYAELRLKEECNNRKKCPYTKPRFEGSFSIEKPVSSCEVRAAKYLAEVIGAEAKQAPSLASDFSLRERLDISFVSFGSHASNYKTKDAIDNEGNHLLGYKEGKFFSKKSGRTVLQPNLEQDFDYGLILKLHPTQFSKRTWFVCAGIGEWGTSGAAWYLAHKWQEIYHYAKQKPFAIIVRVRSNQDESAEPVFNIFSSDLI